MQRGALIFDSHIHLYRHFDLTRLFASAVDNIAAIALQQHVHENYIAVLGLTLTDSEMSWNELYQLTLKEYKLTGQGGNWQLFNLPEQGLIKAINEKHQSLYLIPGAQIITSENLELLVLGSPSPARAQDKSLAWHIEQNSDHLLIAPWGVGKWLKKRGAIINKALTEISSTLVLGDNGGRPWFWRNISQFHQAQELKVPVWPGSDPLPLAGEESRAGANTITITNFNLDDISCPNLIRALSENRNNFIKCHKPESLFRFFKNQISLRLSHTNKTPS